VVKSHGETSISERRNAIYSQGTILKGKPVEFVHVPNRPILKVHEMDCYSGPRPELNPGPTYQYYRDIGHIVNITRGKPF
jgi:hypothetical protein